MRKSHTEIHILCQIMSDYCTISIFILLKRFSAISLIFLLVLSLFANYFALRLVERVVIDNKFSDTEISTSIKVSESLGISKDVLLRKSNIKDNFSLGYAAPFIVPHDNEYYEVVENPVNIEVRSSILKFEKISNSDRNNVSLIIPNLSLTYILITTDFTLSTLLTIKSVNLSYYSNPLYKTLLSVAVPPPQF